LLKSIIGFFSSSPESEAVTKKEAPSGLESPADWLLEQFGATPTAAGRAARPLHVPTSACAVTAIAETVGTLPAKIYEKLPGGDKRPSDHAANVLVHDRASPWQSASDLRREVTRDALTHAAGGFALVLKVDGRPIEMHRINPGAVRVDIDKQTAEPSYLVTLERGGERRYSWNEIVHIRPLGGIPPAHIAREATAFLDLIAEHVSTVFKNGARPGGILNPQRKLNETEISNFAKLIRLQSGGEKKGNALVLPEPVNFDAGGAQTVVDSNVEGLWRLQTLLIAQSYRVPPHVLMSYGEMKWANIEHAGREWLSCLLPWLDQWSFQYARTLLNDRERDAYDIEFIVEELLKASYAERIEGYAKLRAMNAINGAEVRRFENMQPVENEFVRSYANPNTTSQTPGSEGEGNNEQ
jgi:HK97 family phage portal protein